MSLLDDVEDLKMPELKRTDTMTNEDITKAFWNDLKDSLELLETFSKDEIKDFVKNHMAEEVKEIQEQFEEDFKGIPDDEPFKFEVLCLLGKLGINIYDKEEEEKRLQKLKEFEEEFKKLTFQKS